MFTIKRFAHIMRPKLRTVIPSNFVFFDTETKLIGTKNKQGLGKHELWFGWCYAYRLEGGKKTREIWFRFTTRSQFFDFIKSRCVQNKPLYVYAHNLGFDLPIVGFFEDMKTHGFRTTFYTFDSPPTIFKCTWKGHTVNFVDTLNYWTVPLAKLGESLGCKKLPMPKDKMSRSVWDVYAKRDVEIISNAVESLCSFVVKHHCGGIGLTLAGLSMNAFRFRHMKHEIFIHDRVKVCELERDAYYGGLVNCYYMGQVPAKPVYNLDINSHYPSVMRNGFPVKLIHESDKCSLEELKIYLRTKCVIAKVMLNTKSESFPKRRLHKLMYCVGRFSTVLCGPELERALKSRCIVKVQKVAVYEKQYIFRGFVSYFWNLRLQYLKQGQDTDAFFCKILLNSLYGKFGQRGAAWVDISQVVLDYAKKIYKFDEGGSKYNVNNVPIESEPYYHWTPEGCKEMLYLRNVLNGIQIKLPIPEHHESFPAIAAYVTSYGREELLRLIRIAGNRNVFYCDTDSLFTNKLGFDRLRVQGEFAQFELGRLKLAAKAPRLIIRGPKDYSYGDKTVIKGIRKDAKQLSLHEYEQIRFEGIRGIIRRGGGAYVEITTVKKKLKRIYDKGLILSTGWVRPLTLSEF